MTQSTVLQVAVALAQVAHQQMPHQGFGVGVEALREMQLSLEDVLVDDKWVVVGEGVDSCNHLVDEHAESPPIHWFSVSLILQDLGSEVFRRAAERESPSFDDLGKAEVRQLQVSIGPNKNVFWLQIAIDDILAVQILENSNNMCRVKAG